MENTIYHVFNVQYNQYITYDNLIDTVTYLREFLKEGGRLRDIHIIKGGSVQELQWSLVDS